MSLRSTIKYHLYNSLPGPLRAFPYFGSSLHFPKSSHLFARTCKSTVFEPEIVRALSSFVKPESWYLDIGANIGLLSAPILHHHPRCKVMSFEPSPNALPHLLRTNSKSPYHNRWIISPKAVGAEIGSTQFHTHGNDLNAFDGIVNTGRATGSVEISVPVTTIDYEWQMLNSPPVSAMKIDVEGGELSVLKGARNCISITRPTIVLEWNHLNFVHYGVTHSNLVDWCHEHRYRIFSVAYTHPIENETELHVANALGEENFLLFPAS